MIDRVVALTTLGSVVLGAVLALAGGVWTERWKQRKEAKAAARLVWLELMISYSTLLAVIALDEWPAHYTFTDDAWMAQRDRLALIRSAEEFRELQTAYLVLRQLWQVSPDQRSDPVLYWPVLVSVDRALRMLSEAAGVEQAQLDKLRTPLLGRLAEVRTAAAASRALLGQGQGQGELGDPMAKVLDEFPPELRARAAEAIARARSGTPEPASEDHNRTGSSR